MSQSEEERFWNMADAFIALANKYTEDADPNEVNAAMTFAATRFSAFIAASSSVDKQQFIEDMDDNIQYLGKQYRRMLGDNLRDYRENFKAYTRTEE